MGHLYALRGAYFHHVRLMLRKGAYWWFPFAYLPSVLVLSWIASRSDDPVVVQYIAFGAFILTMWNQFLSEMSWQLGGELYDGTFALSLVTRTPVMLATLGKSLATATFGLAYGTLAFITVLLISGQPLDSANTSLLAASVAVTVLAILTTGFLLSPLSVLRRGAGGMINVFIQMGTVFGGILFPVALLPESLRFLSWLLPSSWAMQGIAASIRGGEAGSSIAGDLLAASSLAALYAALAVLVFRRVEKHLRVSGAIDIA